MRALYITSEDPGTPFTVTEFRDSNEEAEEVDDWCAELCQLAIGESVTWDHGCCGTQTLTRVQ